jgi:hypothetical protein
MKKQVRLLVISVFLLAMAASAFAVMAYQGSGLSGANP